MNNVLNLTLHLAALLGPIFAVVSVTPSIRTIKARLKLAAWLAGFSGICAWLLSGYCAPHPFLTMDQGPMPPDYAFVVTSGVVFTISAVVSVFLPFRSEAKMGHYQV